ncbi:MAG: hypothetical protein ACI39W_05355 [Brotaphodocola sp.]
MLNFEKKWEEQIYQLMPVIETERAAYISKEHGRLKAIMGTGYWEEETKSYQIFHGRVGDDLALIDMKIRDPFDITIEELFWITKQVKKVERCGTYSYLAFFNMFPRDLTRIKLLAACWSKLTHMQICTEEEVREVLDGHDAYLNALCEDEVKVIK